MSKGRAIATAVAAAIVAWSCGSAGVIETAGSTTPGAPPTTIGTTTTIGPTTSCPPSTETAPTTAPSATTTARAETTTTVDPFIVDIQQRLTDIGYWLGPVDGVWGPSSAHAAVAFQKVEGLEPTGVADQSLLDSLTTTSRPPPHDPTRPGREIDLDRQVAMLVVDGATRWVLDISSGASATSTPIGEFTVTREIDGNRVSPLGVLYRPKYFTGGYAIHGYPSVPAYPASHGCVRVTFAAMDLLWAEPYLPVGARVTVYG